MSRLRQYLSQTPEDKQEAATIAYLASLEVISRSKPLVAESILNELRDQRNNLKLIASENFSSLAVQLAMGNLLTDKYSEGYVNHRFYSGCGNVDVVEGEATNLAKKVFGADHAYVQPHSGADANLVAFWSILVQRVQNREVESLGKLKLDELSDEEYEKVRQLMMSQKVMGLSLSSGGHLTHGYRHNVSSKMMQAVCYDVDRKSGLIDYTALAEQVKREKPDILIGGYSAYPRRINFATMKEIADSVGAVFMVDMAHFAGLVAGKVFQGDYDPVPFADIVTSTTHKTLRGPRGGLILCKKEYGDTIDKGCPLVLGGPLPHVMAAKAIALDEASRPEFQEYAGRIVNNAQALAEHVQKEGGKILTGGTDNHLIVLDVRSFGLTGRQAEAALREAGCTSNRNTVPFDPNGPWYTSGVRLGTPAISTLGMGKEEMAEVASVIVDVLKNTKPTIVAKTGAPSKAKFETNEEVLSHAKARVSDLLGRFPLYPELELENQVYSSAKVQ
ncbi:MAG: glycine hydroxymethyltransferase [Chlamydiales bacterium]|jgi:glycine hydroxymethyltransferase